jgi:DNA-binding NarL/FixJ family response regulator
LKLQAKLRAWRAGLGLISYHLRRARRPLPQPSPRRPHREREVLQLLAEGRSNRTVSALLGISTKTVETHRTAMMKKLGLGSIAELVRYALRNSVIQA